MAHEEAPSQAAHDVVPLHDPAQGRPRAGASVRYLSSAWDWVEFAVVLSAVAIGSIGLAGLLLGMLGLWSTPAALALAAAPTAGGAVALVHRPVRTAGHSWVPLVAAVLFSIVATAVWAAYPSQHVLVNRDPGSYTTTAVHLATQGDLRVDQRGTPFEDVAATPEGATYVTGPGTYEFQFNHLLSAVMAPVFDVVGAGAMFRVPALLAGLGLLAVYLVAVAATSRPWLSLVVPVALGASLPMLYVARDTFSESLTFLLLWSGVLMALRATMSARPALGLVAGWLLGAAIATRVDALVYAIALLPLLIVWVSGSVPDRRRRIGTAVAVVGAAALPTVLGQVDLAWFTGDYASDLAEETRLLRLGVAGAALGGALLVALRRRAADVSDGMRSTLGAAAGAGLSLFLLYLWFVRPVITELRFSARPALTGYQAAEGVPVDPTRSHHEAAFVWMEWYLGPVVVALAIVGLALVVHRAVTSRASVGELVVVSIGLVSGLLYWWRPSIFADQPWGSRRFAPAVYPAAIMAAVVALGHGIAALGRAAVPHRRLMAGCVSAAMVLPVAATTWPVREGRSQSGYLAPILTTCETIGTDAAVVTLETRDPRRLAPAVRSWCGVPTVSLADPTPATLASLSDQWADRDRQLWVVSEEPADVRGALPDAVLRGSAIGAGDKAIERTLTRPPQRYRTPEPARIWMAPVDDPS